MPKSEQSCRVCGVSGAIYGFTETSNNVSHQRSILTRASIETQLLFGQSVLKIEDCSPSATFLTTMASQTSSCRGHERSLYPILLFVRVNLSTKTPFCERYLSLGVKVNEHCRFPNCMLSCVMVRLGPEDTTRLIPVRLEVVERSTSRYTVTILEFEKFEGRSTFSMRLFVSGSFECNFDTLSNLSKFVSLSLFCFAVEISKRTAHCWLDVAFVHVIV